MSSQDLFKQAEHEQEQMTRVQQEMQDIRNRFESEERAAKDRYDAHAKEHERLMRDAESALKQEQEEARRAIEKANEGHPVKEVIKRSIF